RSSGENVLLPRFADTREHPRPAADTTWRDRGARCSERARPSTEGPRQDQSIQRHGALPETKPPVAPRCCPTLPPSELRGLPDGGLTRREAAWPHPPNDRRWPRTAEKPGPPAR